jgi:quercetin dioxygenase-like cupin family protein
MTNTRLPLIVPPNVGEDVGGVMCKVRSEATGGAYSILELTLAPGSGAPEHVHQREDEIFYVVEGECEIQAGGQTWVAGAGSVVVLPKGVPHAFRNTGLSLTRILITAVPGGLEKFFEEASQISASDPDAKARFDDIARRYQIDFSPQQRAD